MQGKAMLLVPSTLYLGLYPHYKVEDIDNNTFPYTKTTNVTSIAPSTITCFPICIRCKSLKTKIIFFNRNKSLDKNDQTNSKSKILKQNIIKYEPHKLV
jgi:hypothetical protein